jgi:hypothetical protein
LRREAMVRLLPDGDTGLMTLQVEGILDDKTWWFGIKIAQEYWEDLCQDSSCITEEQDPKTVPEAYAHEREFWGWLAEENADRLEANAVPGSSDRHLWYVWPNYSSLEAAFRKHRFKTVE